jgi:hypothetical protein
MAGALLQLELEIQSLDGRGEESLSAEVAQGPGGSARWTLRAETVSGGGGAGRPIVAHAFAWSGAALAEAGSLLHAGRRERIRIRRAMLRPGILAGIAWRDEEIAAILRTAARHHDLHGALDIAAGSGVDVAGDAACAHLSVPPLGWAAVLRPLDCADDATPLVDVRTERGAAPSPDLDDGRRGSSLVASAVAALALERRALARLAGGVEADTALPAPAFVWPVLETLGDREVVVRAGEILEVLVGGGHQGIAPARLEAARRGLEEGGAGLLRAAEAFGQMAAWASPRDERHVAYAAFARRLRTLAAREAGARVSASPEAAR